MFIKRTNDYIRFSFFPVTIEKDLHYDMVKSFRLFGVKIFYRIFNLNSYENKFLFKNWTNRIEYNNSRRDIVSCYKIIQEAQKEEIHKNYINLIGAPSGEIFCFANVLAEFIQKYQLSEYCFIADVSWKKHLLNWFFPTTPCIVIRTKLYLHEKLIFNAEDGTKLFNIFPTMHYVNQDKQIVNAGSHYFLEICKTLGIESKSGSFVPKISHQAKLKVEQWVKENRVDWGKLVVLCPAANSCKAISNDILNKISSNIKLLGGGVFVNSNKPGEIRGDFFEFFTHEELFYLCSKSQAVIGLRSGLIEILAASQVPVVALYSGFPQRGALSAMDSRFVLKGFSIKKLPNIDIRRILEIDLEAHTDNFIITRIINFLRKLS